jgi:hypothetical protein
MDGLRRGIENMLRHCAGLEPGQSLLILTEDPSAGHYDPGLAPAVAAAAEAMGLRAGLLELPFSPRAEAPPSAAMAAIGAADRALFLSRRGDQLRFDAAMAAAAPVICYALDREMMASGFGAADHRAFVALLGCLNGALAAARHIRVTCPLGTDFEGPGARFAPAGEVTVRRFPLSVFSPVPAAGYRGTIALAGFLTGTGRTYYDPQDLPLSGVLTVAFDGDRITGFGGPDAARARAHYDRVGALLGIDALFLHSWHAGMHPGCAYRRQAGENLSRWGGGAFGNPRLLHFHSCGAYAPGEISLNVIDPTIRLDGVAVWQDGRLHPERVPGGAAILDRYPCAAALFQSPAAAVGLAPSGRLSARVEAPPTSPE